MGVQRDTAWVGIDVGKTHHWACVVNADGKTVLSTKIANDEAEIVAFLASAGSQARQLIWAVDIIGAPSALLLALLTRAGQPVRYASGRVVARQRRATFTRTMHRVQPSPGQCSFQLDATATTATPIP